MPAGSPYKVLVVEDVFLVANELEYTLGEEGFDVSTAGSVEAAFGVLEQKGCPDAALLDINLGDENVFPIAERLQDEGVPFVFATGYDDRSILPERFQEVRALEKPYRFDEIGPVLKEIARQNTKQRSG